MKRIIITFIILAITIVVGNAQFFVEGGIGIEYVEIKSSLSSISNDVPQSTFSFSFSPKVGYGLNDKTAVGAMAYLSRFTYKKDKVDPNDIYELEFEVTENIRRFAVFNRYKLLGTEKLSILIETSIFIEGYKADGYKIEEYRSPEKISLAQSGTAFGLNAVPLITYDLTDKFSLSATPNFLNLGVHSQTVKREESGLKTKVIAFGFSADSTVFSSLSGIMIGFIYKF